MAQESEFIQHTGFLSMGHPEGTLAVVLHGILGSQNERRETGQRLRQLQERVLMERAGGTESSSQCLMAIPPCFYHRLKTGSVISTVIVTVHCLKCCFEVV